PQYEAHLTIVFGIGLFQVGADGTEVCLGPFGCDPFLEVSHHHDEIVASTIVQVVSPFYLLLVHERHIESGREKHESPAESRRGDSENREWVFIHLHHATDHATVVVKM